MRLHDNCGNHHHGTDRGAREIDGVVYINAAMDLVPKPMVFHVSHREVAPGEGDAGTSGEGGKTKKGCAVS